jgi:para-aminobenzoate synthetase/4-amino-4-deoxychorismate lyase
MKVLIQFEKRPLLFSAPESIISCYDAGLLNDCFGQMEKAISAGCYLAGFLSYEAGYSFEPKLGRISSGDFPLLCFGVYRRPERAGLAAGPFTRLPEGMRLNISRGDYSSDIGAIRGHIAAGDVYQITYCLKLLFKFDGEPLSLYKRLFEIQPVPYPAYIEAEGFHILSLSPELFIRKVSGRILTKPMKGTWPRGGGLLSDILSPLRLKYDPKNRAENVMIADLLRNDLGRICLGVRAPRLFEVDRYKTLCQMTSTVTARITNDWRKDGVCPGLRTIVFIIRKQRGARAVPASSVQIILLTEVMAERFPVTAPPAAMISHSHRNRPAVASVPPPRMPASRISRNCDAVLTNPVRSSSGLRPAAGIIAAGGASAGACPFSGKCDFLM